LSAYVAEKNDYQVRLLSTVVTAKCACIRNINVSFFPIYACKSSWSTF